MRQESSTMKVSCFSVCDQIHTSSFEVMNRSLTISITVMRISQQPAYLQLIQGPHPASVCCAGAGGLGGVGLVGGGRPRASTRCAASLGGPGRGGLRKVRLLHLGPPHISCLQRHVGAGGVRRAALAPGAIPAPGCCCGCIRVRLWLAGSLLTLPGGRCLQSIPRYADLFVSTGTRALVSITNKVQ